MHRGAPIFILFLRVKIIFMYHDSVLQVDFSARRIGGFCYEFVPATMVALQISVLYVYVLKFMQGWIVFLQY